MVLSGSLMKSYIRKEITQMSDQIHTDTPNGRKILQIIFGVDSDIFIKRPATASTLEAKAKIVSRVK